MIAYKGFSKDLKGHGGYKFTLGKTYKEPESKTAREGFHATENPFECLQYFPLGGENRYFKVELTGDIDEDDCERIAGTKLRLLKELSITELALEGMTYMINHPGRKRWEQKRRCLQVSKDTAKADNPGMIAIARGRNPKVCGVEGSICGLLREKDGEIREAKLFTAGKGARADTWYTLDDGLKEVTT